MCRSGHGNDLVRTSKNSEILALTLPRSVAQPAQPIAAYVGKTQRSGFPASVR